MTAWAIATHKGGMTTTSSLDTTAIRQKIEEFMPQIQELFQKILDHFSKHKEEALPSQEESKFHLMTLEEFKDRLAALQQQLEQARENFNAKFTEEHPQAVEKYHEIVAKLEEIGQQLHIDESNAKIKQFADETATRLRGAFSHAGEGEATTAAAHL